MRYIPAKVVFDDLETTMTLLTLKRKVKNEIYPSESRF